MGSGDGNFNVEYIKFDGSGDLDLRSVLRLYVRDAYFLGALDGDNGSSCASVISNESL